VRSRATPVSMPVVVGASVFVDIADQSGGCVGR
jgi:hypothetical protein